MMLLRKQNYGRKNRFGQEDELSGERWSNPSGAHCTQFQHGHWSRNNGKLIQYGGSRSKEDFRDTTGENVGDKWSHIEARGKDYYSKGSSRNGFKMVVQLWKWSRLSQFFFCFVLGGMNVERSWVCLKNIEFKLPERI